MRNVEWKKRNGTMACHSIYTKAEANRTGLKYIHDWREGEIGEWVLTDDEHVVQILKVYYDRANRKLIHTCTMTTNAGSPTCKLDVQHRKSRYTLNGKVQPTKAPKHLTPRVAAMCTFIVAGMHPEKAFVASFYGFECIDKPITKYIRTKVRDLMASDIVKQEIKRSLGEKLDKEGLTVEWILKEYKKVVVEGDNYPAKVTVLNKLSQYQGIDGPSDKTPLAPMIPQETLDKLANLTKIGKTEKEPIEAEIISSGEIVEAEIVKDVSDEVKIEESNDESDLSDSSRFVNGFSVYRGERAS